MTEERNEVWWHDFSWEKYATTTMEPTMAKQIVQIQPQSQEMKPMKCVCCGAPMKSWIRCEYCGTHYGPEAPKEDDLKRLKLEELKSKLAEVQTRVDEAKRKRAAGEIPSYWNEVLSASKRWKDLGLLSR